MPSAEQLRTMTADRLTVVPELKMSSPSYPPCKVTPEMATVTPPPISNTSLPFEFASIINCEAPGQVIVRFFLITICARLVRRMVEGFARLNVTVSPAAALPMTERNVPLDPSSAVEVTTQPDAAATPVVIEMTKANPQSIRILL